MPACDYSDYKDRLTTLLWTIRNNKTLSPKLIDPTFVGNLNLNYLINDLRDSAGNLSKKKKTDMVAAVKKTLKDVIEAESNRSEVQMDAESPYYSDDETASEEDSESESEDDSDSDNSDSSSSEDE